MLKLSASPEAIEWLEKETGQSLVGYFLDLFQESPLHQALDDLGEDHPAADALYEAIHKPIKSADKKRKMLRDFSILIDYRYITESLRGKDLETRVKLGEKYHMSEVQVFRLLQKFL